MLLILVVISMIFFIAGYRVTALNAAKSNPFVTKDFELIEQHDTGSSVIFLFKSDEQKVYQTVLASKKGLFYHSDTSTKLPYSTDTVQTVGGISYTINDDAATLLSVVSYDDKVAYIEAGVTANRERKEINKGERVTFLFPFSEQIDLLYPTALDQDGNELYYYGYPKDTNVFSVNDLKWHKINE